MTDDLNALYLQIQGSYDLCHVKVQDILEVIEELENARISLSFDADYIKQCQKHLPDMTPAEFWGKE